MTKLLFMAPLALVVTILTNQRTIAEEQIVTQTVSAQCDTAPTGIDGITHTCASHTTVLNAPPNFVFIPRSMQGGEVSYNGKNHDCLYGWKNLIEVIPGTQIIQPTTFWLKATARGPVGHGSGHGWESCHYTIKMTKYK